jgi:hypothetical protein
VLDPTHSAFSVLERESNFSDEMVRIDYLLMIIDTQIGGENVVYDLSGAGHTFDNIQFANAGRNLFMHTADLKNTLMRTDTEYGKTIDEMQYKWKRKDHDFPLEVVVPFQRFSELETPSNNVFDFVGFGGNDKKTVFSMTYDSRDPYRVVNDKSSRKYADSAAAITSIATSPDGYVVTGDAIGAVRLYSDLSQDAKLVLKQFEKVTFDSQLYPNGNPVIGIDIAPNREWVVWTTPTFAALVRFENLKAWDGGIRGEKPHALMLCIHPDDLTKYGIDKIDLLPAKFDILKLKGNGAWIISFCGKYKIKWDMRICKKDLLAEETRCYGQIEEVSSKVLDYVPEYAVEDAVVALGNSVKHLKI